VFNWADVRGAENLTTERADSADAQQLAAKVGHQAHPAAKCWPTPLRRRATPDLGRIRRSVETVHPILNPLDIGGEM